MAAQAALELAKRETYDSILEEDSHEHTGVSPDGSHSNLKTRG